MAIRNFISDHQEMVQPVDAIQLMTKNQQLNNFIQQGQQGQQELELGKQKIESARTAADKAKRIEDDTRKFGEVYLAAKGNPDETIRLASQSGVHPEIIQNFQKHHAELSAKAAQTDAALLPIKQEKLKQAQGMLMEVEGMAPEALVQAWPMLYKKALTLDPEAAGYLSPMEPPNAQQFAALNAAVAHQDYYLKKESEKRLTATAAQQATAAGDVHAVQAAELPVKRAVAGATLANPGLLNPGQQAQATVAEGAAKERVMTRGERERHNRAMETKNTAGGSGGPIDPGMVEAIKGNPSLLWGLTPTVRGRLIPELQRQGVDTGKPMSDGAVKTLSELESGIQSLDSTVAAIRQGEQNMGPFAGWATSKNPWASDAGKRLQSQIDLTRQIVGKGFEGGVLRKEDEVKYKAILADITNTPSSAVAKLENVRTELENKLGTWEKNQRGAGRSVPKRETAPEGGGPARPKSKAEFDALPSGATFIAPDGSERRKP